MAKSVFITGAGAGIGRATVERLTAAGWRVGAYDIDLDGLASLRQEVSAAVENGRLVTGHLDVRDAAEWAERLAEFTERTDGALDVLINNAGVLSSGEFADIPLARQDLMVDVNVHGTINGCYAAYPHLIKADGAQVLNLCSASAIYGQAELATYSATKFAVRGLTEALDLEWAAKGIRVRALWPLFVKTAMTEGMDIGTTRSLGIRLTADDVAESVLETLTEVPTRFPHGVHRGVGKQARTMLAASNLAPSWALRQVNNRLAQRTGH